MNSTTNYLLAWVPTYGDETERMLCCVLVLQPPPLPSQQHCASVSNFDFIDTVVLVGVVVVVAAAMLLHILCYVECACL